MPLLRVFYFVGDRVNIKDKDGLVLIVGILGTLLCLFGLTQSQPFTYYVISSILLLITAIYHKLTYFIALELILIEGFVAIILGIGPTLQFALPILLCIQLLVYYVVSGQLHSIFRLIGIIGIAILSIGVSFQNQWGLLIGSLAVGIFAYSSAHRGRKISLLWAVLNTVIVFVAAYRLVFEGS